MSAPSKARYQLPYHPSDILLGLQHIAYTIVSLFLRLYKLGVVIEREGVVTLIFGKLGCGSAVDTPFTAKPYAG
jgi:hypothetical protein